MPNKPVKRKTRTALPPKPPEPHRPDEPYEFGDFVRVVQKDFYYGRQIYKIIKYGVEYGEEAWAEGIIDHHVSLPDRDLKELGVKRAQLSGKCSNNTKLNFLYFTKYT